ncbi:YDG domain-containing protein [Selenomonas dianae]|uniref:Filamentous haemagglutinin FhaB/tRNA nuclease CdiA-like TPS domain-containing protein n=1 Tax=Selenomonas dianae TaxID=135079 RepID=A0ABN0T0K3_9FIRM|nr:YDG domain-containing protein [Selenomonas dianae]WLD82224.1 YDG domain-containing protein [Selenomonas dianae]
MKASSNAHLRRTLLCALVAGSIAAPFAVPHAYALPIEGAHAATNAGEANISTSGTTMDITGKTEHNVLRWEDFSIDSGEKVRFDGGNQERDYLNLVTGEGASNIYGTIEGGRNVYLVNPHGILFAKGSEVNTGALYLSTANVDAVASAAGTSWGGNSPLSASTQYGNVLNLGTVQASKLYIEGKNVKVLNTDDIQNTDGTALTGNAVTIRSENTPHIGYDVGHKTTENIDVNGAATPYQVFDYASTNADHHKASAKSRGWDVANLGGTAHTDYDYMRVHTVYDLQNMNAKLDGRYILAGDIDAGVTNTWNSTVYGIEGFLPIGENFSTQFTGRFDGAGHALRGLYINRPHENFQGLFGYASGARIENLSLVDGNVKGNYVVGGIVGRADDTEIRNVSYAGRVNGDQVVGGIVGYASEAAKIQNVCNTGAVSGTDQIAGGVVGYASEAAKIQNVCNTGTITGSKLVGGIVGAIDDSTLQHAWNTGTVTGNQKVGGIVGQALGGSIRHAVWKSGSAGQAVGASSNGADVTTDVKFAAEADMKLAATYTDWKDANGTALVATEGGKGTPWRIYEGKTTPMLTALMKGTKRLAKVYDGKTFGDGDAHILSDTALEKNVGTRDASGIYSDAFGYDLIGSTYRITPKELNLALANGARFDKTYDGNANVAQSLTKDGNYSLTGFITGEGAGIELSAVTGKYADKNAARDKAVTFDGLTLTGTGAGNYVLNKTSLTGIGTISPKQLNLALTSGARFDKMYDGTANVTQSLTKDRNYTLTNFVSGEGADIALAPVTGTYADKNAGTGKAVTFGGLTLTGAGAGNYSLSATTLTTTGDIARKTLTLEGTAGTQFTKIYDGNATVTQNLVRGTNYRLAGVVEGEGTDIVTLNESAAQGAYATANAQAAGAQQNVTFRNLALTGSGAANYTLAANKTFENAGRITPRELNLALANGARFDKTYDGTANVTQTLTKGTNYNLNGFVTGEGAGIELDTVTGKYADKNAAANKAVTFGGLTLTGTGAGNYVLNKTALTGTGTISPKQLNLALTSGARFDKTYDGNANVTQSLTKGTNYTLTNFADGEGAGITITGAGTYTDKNAGTGKTVNFTGLTLTGAGAGNYRLSTDTLTGTGTITHRDLTLTADAQSIVQGEALPSFTGRAEGFADGEDERVFGTDGITFGTTLTNTDTPGSYGLTGRIGSTSDGVVGNYRIGQAAGNATAFTIHAAALPGGLLASLVQDAAPRFDMGFGQEVYVFGLPRPVPTATLGIYRFAAARDISIEGVRLD